MTFKKDCDPMKSHFNLNQVLAFIFTFLLVVLSSVNAQDNPSEVVDRSGANPSTPVRRPSQSRNSSPSSPMADPRRWMFISVVAFLMFGGGRKWLKSIHGRRLADKIAHGTANPDEILGSYRYGRVVVQDLFEALTGGASDEIRHSAFEALVRLWQADELIAEEEKAIVTRSFQIKWNHRRKYPVSLNGTFDISATYGLFELKDSELQRWLSDHSRWSYRIQGTRRAVDEQWKQNLCDPPFALTEINSRDFPENTVHRIALFVRFRTFNQTSNWEIELPSQPTSFEWDLNLELNALLAPIVESELDVFTNAMNWQPASLPGPGQEGPRLVQISPGFAIHNPPETVISSPLPRDLSHAVFIELQGVTGLIPAGEWLIACRKSSENLFQSYRSGSHWDVSPDSYIDDQLIGHAGRFQMRLVLKPIAHRGWANPEIRSVFNSKISFPWVEIEIVRT